MGHQEEKFLTPTNTTTGRYQQSEIRNTEPDEGRGGVVVVRVRGKQEMKLPISLKALCSKEKLGIGNEVRMT